MRHPFFAYVDWNKLYARQLEPPCRPRADRGTEASNFDKTFTQMRIDLPSSTDVIDSKIFSGFSYNNNSDLPPDPAHYAVQHYSAVSASAASSSSASFSGYKAPYSPTMIAADHDDLPPDPDHWAVQHHTQVANNLHQNDFSRNTDATSQEF